MPVFRFSSVIGASVLDTRPLAGWQYRRVPFRAYCRLLLRSTVADSKATVYSGSDTIEQRQPIQAGGTAGTTPTTLNTPQTEWIAMPGDELIVSLDTITAATIDGVIYVDPV
jgi:hypothetical protein